MKASNPKFLKTKAKINGVGFIDACLFFLGVIIAKKKELTGFGVFYLPLGLILGRYLLGIIINKTQIKYLFMKKEGLDWEFAYEKDNRISRKA